LYEISCREKNRGKFIAIEGPEGCGKSTQVRELARYLSDRGFPVVVTREPGGTPFSEKIRNILLADSAEYVSPLAELFLYLASRAQHVMNLIVPSLKTGKVVITDRFSVATFAYQGYGRGIPLKLIKKLNGLSSEGLEPDLTIVVDADSAGGLKRAARVKGKYDRLEKAGLNFHRRVRRGYLELAKKSPGRIKVVKRQSTVTKTQELIRRLVDRCLSGT